jgi:hypothetical protein
VSTPPLVEGRDYYIDADGLYVFTEAYLLARGNCCKSGCRHCPYGFSLEVHEPSRDDIDPDDPAQTH